MIICSPNQKLLKFFRPQKSPTLLISQCLWTNIHLVHNWCKNSSITSLGEFNCFDDYEGDGSQIQDALLEWTGQRTVPNVFIGGKHIGGCDATTALHRGGKLVPLLTEAGALAKSSA